MTDTFTPGAVNRLEYDAGAQQSRAQTQLALLQPAATSPPVPSQMAHPSAQRLQTPAWQGSTSQLNRAQAAQADADVWVTVPVDKVSVAPGGGHSIAPVYASTKGYRPRPGESVGSIPPAVAVGR
ncbi:MAG TPA: hypothetical protein VMU09_05315 [Acidimicrobiales bacterium]|nr:hypothetical protein [Acidimicrobiales bacterium]